MAAYLLRNWQLGVVRFLTISGVLTSGAARTLAQITPDATLGAEGSVVTPSVDVGGQAASQIDGGATRGINLFHSFNQFNVEDGQRVYFTNPTGIENILTRVTGTNASSILGTLGVTGGNANLFLINPNGIIFGQNARLDVGGSFTATTANAVGLGETGLFSASEPTTSNLLTVRPSALFFNTVAAGTIVNQSQAQSLSGQINPLVGDLVGLQVPTSQTLALVGGDVVLKEGKLTAFGGPIELGSVAGNSRVSLTPIDKGWALSYEGVQNFNDIQLSQRTTVDASVLGGGDIQVQGRHVTLTNESKILAETLGSQSGGNIFIRAEQLNIEDASVVDASTFSSGRGGNITIDTKKLLVQSGATISTGTFGQGEAGNLLVNASDSVELIGTLSPADQLSRNLLGQILEEYLPEYFPLPSSLSTPVFLGAGVAGDLTIVTGKLIVRDGAVVSTGPLGGLVVRNGEVVSIDPIGQGQGGNLKVTASDSVELIGTSLNGQLPSGLFSQSVGNSASGNLAITTGKLIVRNGAVVSAATFGQGQGGNLEVSASDSVELIGTSPITQIGSSLLTYTQGSGSAGDLRITTSKLIVQDRAFVFAGTQGQGQGGNLEVSASDSVELIGTSPDNGQGTGLFTVTKGAGTWVIKKLALIRLYSS
jgi:filamentous hemagglutinin family protein